MEKFAKRKTFVHFVLAIHVGQRLEPLFAPIRYKLASALTNWHPADPSAKMILQPWTKVGTGTDKKA